MKFVIFTQISFVFMEFFEGQEASCCISIGQVPDGITPFYRALKSSAATSDCFRSTKFGNPNRLAKPPFTECHIHGLSVFQNLDDCLVRFKTAKAKRNPAPIIIGEIVFTNQDGLICLSGNPSHHTFWRSLSFDFTKTNVIAHVS